MTPSIIFSTPCIITQSIIWQLVRYNWRLEQRFRLDVEQIETEVKMRYVTSIERLAMQEGREEGLEEGRQAGMREMLVETLRTRFGEVTEELLGRLNQVQDEEILKMLNRQALLADTLAEFEEAMSL